MLLKCLCLKTVCLLLFVVSPLGLAAEVTHAPKAVVYPEGAPFTELVVVDETIYLAGMIGVKPGSMTLVPGGIEAESKQVLDNIKQVLEANGFAMANLVKCTAMLADISQWSAFNAIYKTYFTSPYPARSALGANGLALGAAVELECIGTVGSK